MIQLNGTAACDMRDQLWKLVWEKKITKPQITDRLAKMELPDWLQSQILQMTKYRQCDRTTDSVEQAMEAAVHRKIIDKILKEENQQP